MNNDNKIKDILTGKTTIEPSMKIRTYDFLKISDVINHLFGYIHAYSEARKAPPLYDKPITSIGRGVYYIKFIDADYITDVLFMKSTNMIYCFNKKDNKTYKANYSPISKDNIHLIGKVETI